MYYYLMGAIKRKVLSELKTAFRDSFPRHKDILPFIGHKYAFKQRPQKGIVVQGASSNTLRLSADNFQGTVESHVMLTGIPNRRGHSLEWVREDSLLLNSIGYFPTSPGIYYVEIYSPERLESTLGTTAYNQVVTNQGESPFYFYVDALLSVKQQQLLQSTGVETQVYIPNYPVHEGSLRLYADGHPLMQGQFLRLSSNQSLSVVRFSDPEVTLGLESGNVPPCVSTLRGPFVITSTVNDTLTLEVDDYLASITLTQGTLTADDLARDIRNGLYQAGLPAQDILVTSDGQCVEIKASKTLRFESDLFSTANSTLGLTEGFVSPELEGCLFPLYAPCDSTITFEVDGEVKTFPIYEGQQDLTDLSSRLSAFFTGLQVDVEEGGDFQLDEQTGVVTLRRPLYTGTVLTASYSYPGDTLGPFAVDYNTANNKVLPGVVLAFGNRISDEDKQAVVVYDQRVQTASEYGGRWEVNVDMSIITRDPTTQEEISDFLLMYFFAVRKEDLSDEGLELVDISFGGEVEEVYDDNDETFYFNSSLSLAFQTDWSIQTPLPLTIEQVTPTSFVARAKAAQTGNLAEVDLLIPGTPGDILEAQSLIFPGKNSDYEDID